MHTYAASGKRAIFFVSCGDNFAVLPWFSSLGHGYLIGAQHVLKKSTSDGRKIGDFIFGGDNFAVLPWNSSWDYGRRKFVNIISGESSHGQLARGADKAAFLYWNSSWDMAECTDWSHFKTISELNRICQEL